MCNNKQIIEPTIISELKEIKIDGKILLYVHIEESTEIHKNKGKVYIRNYEGDFDISNNIPLIASIHNKKRKIFDEDTVYPYVSVEEDLRHQATVYLEENKVNDLIDRLRIQTEYVTLFKMVTEAILLARYIMETEEEHSGKFWDSVIDTFRHRMDDLQKEEKHLSEFWQRTNYHPHTIYTLLDPERIECLWNKLYEKTKEVLCH